MNPSACKLRHSKSAASLNPSAEFPLIDHSKCSARGTVTNLIAIVFATCMVRRAEVRVTFDRA